MSARHLAARGIERRKVTVRGDLGDLAVEAARLDRSKSWVMQRAWEIARAQIRAMPAPGTER